MKKSMLILLLMFLMSACDDTENSQKIGENPSVQTTQETLAVTDLTTTEKAVIREKTTTQATTVIDFENSAKFQIETKSFEETTAEIPEIQPKTTELQTTVTVSENADEKRSDDSVTTAKIPETQPKTESQTTITVSENADEKKSEDSEETAEPAQTTAKIPETQPKTESQETVTVSENAEEKEPVDSVTTAVQTETKVTEIPDIPRKTDYEKALEIYNFVRENVSGTCINYACQTYEMCREVGLPCCIVWTNAGMYGHVANTVEIGNIWYILDTQGGYFLDYNYGFTEVVDIDGNHISDGDILSNYSYDELN